MPNNCDDTKNLNHGLVVEKKGIVCFGLFLQINACRKEGHEQGEHSIELIS